MTKEIIEAMEKLGYEKIIWADYDPNDFNFLKICQPTDNLYFKKKEKPKFPKTFENKWYKITVYCDEIFIEEQPHYNSNRYIFCEENIELLIKAVEYYKENTK